MLCIHAHININLCMYVCVNMYDYMLSAAVNLYWAQPPDHDQLFLCPIVILVEIMCWISRHINVHKYINVYIYNLCVLSCSPLRNVWSSTQFDLKVTFVARIDKDSRARVNYYIVSYLLKLVDVQFTCVLMIR